MTYETLKRFAKFLKVKWDVSSGAIRIAEPPDFQDEYITLDWDIRPDDVREFSRVEGLCFTNEKPMKPGHYWYRDPESRPELLYVYADNDGSLVISGLSINKYYPGEWAGPLEPPV